MSAPRRDQEEENFEIVGAALGRTGTLSLKTALDILGYKTYHMYEVFENPKDAHLWLGLQSGAMDGTEVTDILLKRNYNATVDAPGAVFWEQLYEANPDAKVILTYRNFDKWYESASQTIYVAKQPFCMRWISKLPFGPMAKFHDVNHMIQEINWGPKGFFEGKFQDKEYVRGLYTRYFENVKRKVPQDKLLVYEITQGWKPLCEFLKKPVPSDPFPRVNDRATFIEGGASAKSSIQPIMHIFMVLVVLLIVFLFFKFS